jgi:hypothetical protein
MRRRRFFVMLTVLAAFAVPTADAQSSGRPFRTEFGPSDRDDRRARQLVLTGTTYSGLDETTHFGDAAVTDESLQAGRAHQGANLSLALSQRRPRLTFSVSGSTAVRYYHSLNRIGTQRHGGALSGEWWTSAQTSWRFAQSISYSPSYSLSLAGAPADSPGVAPPPETLDYDLNKNKQIRLGAFGGARHVFSASRELTAHYNLSYTNYFAQPDLGMQDAGFRFTERLGAGLALRLGYGIGTGSGTGVSHATRHNIDAGLSFDRSFAVSPRTTMAFTSGSTVVSTTEGRQFELTGTFNLRRRLSPRWTASMAYHRGVTAVDGAADPLIGNTLTSEVGGFLGDRTSISVRPAYTWGADVANPALTFFNVTAVARAQTAISRTWAAYVEYVYYAHEFSDIPGIRPELAHGVRRGGLRTGLALWAPINRQ